MYFKYIFFQKFISDYCSENRRQRGSTCSNYGLTKPLCLSSNDPHHNIPCVYCLSSVCQDLNRGKRCGRGDIFQERNLKLNIDYQACMDKGKKYLK